MLCLLRGDHSPIALPHKLRSQPAKRGKHIFLRDDVIFLVCHIEDVVFNSIILVLIYYLNYYMVTRDHWNHKLVSHSTTLC